LKRFILSSECESNKDWKTYGLSKRFILSGGANPTLDGGPLDKVGN